MLKSFNLPIKRYIFIQFVFFALSISLCLGSNIPEEEKDISANSSKALKLEPEDPKKPMDEIVGASLTRGAFTTSGQYLGGIWFSVQVMT